MATATTLYILTASVPTGHTRNSLRAISSQITDHRSGVCSIREEFDSVEAMRKYLRSRADEVCYTEEEREEMDATINSDEPWVEINGIVTHFGIETRYSGYVVGGGSAKGREHYYDAEGEARNLDTLADCTPFDSEAEAEEWLEEHPDFDGYVVPLNDILGDIS